MLRLLLLKEQGAVGGDVAGVAEAAAVVAVHKVGARLLLPLAVLQVICLLVGSFVIFIDCILNKLPAARIPATAWASRGRLSCLEKKEREDIGDLEHEKGEMHPSKFYNAVSRVVDEVFMANSFAKTLVAIAPTFAFISVCS